MKVKKNIGVIVAHPDDETLWCGGTILSQAQARWLVVCLCRKNDPDRRPKFYQALAALRAEGVMGNLNDGPEQKALGPGTVNKWIVSLLPRQNFDLIITHSPFGEYTSHRRHEEIGRAVIELWDKKKIATRELWCFAFEDGNKNYYPQAIKTADLYQTLPLKIWKEKYRIITKIYGFEKQGFEARTTPKDEAFWRFESPQHARNWLERPPSLLTP